MLVINITQTPTYKLAKFLCKKLKELVRLQNSFTAYISTNVAEDLINTNINANYNLIILDIKDLHVNLRKKEIIQITVTWLT